ncbi:MAG: hypothetical protein MUC41_19620 [Syntrophobacteraceae bacterium]|jgi:hypothetical protein|nr:hypothetical protein [Syntrophobacteraceae bacterium]
MEEIERIINRMDPEEVLAEITRILQTLFSTLGAEVRSQFLWELMGESRGDKVSSLVHL